MGIECIVGLYWIIIGGKSHPDKIWELARTRFTKLVQSVDQSVWEAVINRGHYFVSSTRPCKSSLVSHSISPSQLIHKLHICLLSCCRTERQNVGQGILHTVNKECRYLSCVFILFTMYIQHHSHQIFITYSKKNKVTRNHAVASISGPQYSHF